MCDKGRQDVTRRLQDEIGLGETWDAHLGRDKVRQNTRGRDKVRRIGTMNGKTKRDETKQDMMRDIHHSYAITCH